MTKKFLLLILILIMVFTLVSCKKDEPVEKITEIEGEMVGGFTDVEDGTVTDELLEIFNTAQASWDGIPMEPIKLLQTQVVAGTNYKFLAKQEAINAVSLDGEEKEGIPESYKTVVIYHDLDGNSTIMSVEEYDGEIE